jgi:MerR family transcriptional regulator, copper efflux regulator
LSKGLTAVSFRHICCRNEPAVGELNINELAKLTGSAERQVRYMIAEGFVPPPRGSRSQPEYGEDHVEAIRRYLGLRAVGFPPAAIRILGESGEAARLPIADGVALSIDHRLIGRALDVDMIVERVAAVLKKLQSGSPP